MLTTGGGRRAFGTILDLYSMFPAVCSSDYADSTLFAT